MNQHTSLAQLAPVFDPTYAIEIDAPEGVDEFSHGDLATFNTSDEPRAGDLVCVHTRSGNTLLLTLSLGLAPGVWKRMPFQESSTSTALAALVGVVFGTERRVAIKIENLWAVHVCDGRIPTEEAV